MSGIYQQIKALQHQDVLQAIGAGRGLECPPVHVRLEPIEACNLRCRFCYYYDPVARNAV